MVEKKSLILSNWDWVSEKNIANDAFFYDICSEDPANPNWVLMEKKMFLDSAQKAGLGLAKHGYAGVVSIASIMKLPKLICTIYIWL